MDRIFGETKVLAFLISFPFVFCILVNFVSFVCDIFRRKK